MSKSVPCVTCVFVAQSGYVHPCNSCNVIDPTERENNFVLDKDTQADFGLTTLQVFRSNRAPSMTLPVDSEARKGIPLLSGVLRYFPAALAGVARWSKIGNDKHNPGQDLHHSRGKSSDHGDCILRHLTDLQDLLAVNREGNQIVRKAVLDEASALAWRALALSQELYEKLDGAPLAPAAK